MKKRALVTFVALVVAYFAGGAVAQAQHVSAEVAFPFTAGGKDVAAGKYAAEITPAGPVALTGPNGVRIVMPVITFLARHAQDQAAGFVFDKKDGKSVLSEVWFRGRDGMLLVATSAPHEHAIVPGADPKK